MLYECEDCGKVWLCRDVCVACGGKAELISSSTAAVERKWRRIADRVHRGIQENADALGKLSGRWQDTK